MLSTKQLKEKLEKDPGFRRILPPPSHSSTKVLRWSIFGALGILAMGILIAFFPERRTTTTNTQTRTTTTTLTSYDVLEGRTTPSSALPKTVGYDGVITGLTNSSLSVKLSNGNVVTVALSKKTSYELWTERAQPKNAQRSDIEPGQPVSILAEPTHQASQYLATKIIVKDSTH
jgi:hypothetical protein